MDNKWIIAFYAVLAIGFIAFIKLSIKYNRVRRIVLQTSKKESNAKQVFNYIKKIVRLWFYYFTNGDRTKIMQNSAILFISFLAAWIVNNQVFRMSFVLFFILFAIVVIYGVWYVGKRRNYQAFSDAFPQMLQTMLAASSAGAGLLQALERCGVDMKGKLADEFKALYRRLAIGEDSLTVFEDSYLRYPYKEYYYFIIIIKTNLKRGGQIREIIGRLSRLIADSNKMEQKKRTMTSEARMSAMIVAAIPALFFVFMKFAMPENFDFVVSNPNGRWVLYYVIGSEVLGLSIIWYLMKKAT